jgi:hypothetical protein
MRLGIPLQGAIRPSRRAVFFTKSGKPVKVKRLAS